jgi:hypothetical protein
MTVEEEIAFWRRKAEEAETRELMMFCFGVEYGLGIARDDHFVK